MKDLKYISLAHKLNTKHHELMLQHKLHFRGNVKSISLISLAKETPEIGESNIRSEKGALLKLEAIINGTLPLLKNRNTREKELQAWLILNALSSNKQLFFDSKLQFITSELALISRPCFGAGMHAASGIPPLHGCSTDSVGDAVAAHARAPRARVLSGGRARSPSGRRRRRSSGSCIHRGREDGRPRARGSKAASPARDPRSRRSAYR